MILVDIYVPSVDKEYNFSLDDNVPIHIIVEEITEMIAQKEKTCLFGDFKKMVLCSKAEEKTLPGNSTLSECNIVTGSLLLLV